MEKILKLGALTTALAICLQSGIAQSASTEGAVISEDAQDVSSAAGNASSNALTKDQVIDQLSSGMDDSERDVLIEYIANVPVEDYSAFVKTVNLLSEGTGVLPFVFIENVAKVPAEHYSAFVHTVKVVSEGDDIEFARVMAVKSVAKVPAEHYPAFVNAVKDLLEWNRLELPDCMENIYVMAAVDMISVEHYSAFVNTVKALSEGISKEHKFSVMGAVAMIPAEHYQNFMMTMKTLPTSFSQEYRKAFMNVLVTINPDRYTYLQRLMQSHPQYFKQLPSSGRFPRKFTHDMTEDQLREAFEDMYKRDNPGALPPAPANKLYVNPDSAEARANRAAGDAYLATQRARDREAASARGDEARLRQMEETDRTMEQLQREQDNNKAKKKKINPARNYR